MPRGSFDDLAAFAVVGRERSFTKVAARLGVSQSALSQTIRQLETRLGVRLLTRTTRSVAPTEAGERLLQTVGPRFEEIEAELAALSELREKPAGTIRITATEYAADTILLCRSLRSCCRRIPTSRSRSSSTTASPTLSRERYDAGVRSGEQVAKDMIAVRYRARLAHGCRRARRPISRTGQSRSGRRTWSSTTASTCASPTHGGVYAWEFEKGGRELKVRVEGQMTCNGAGQMLNAALAGYGLAYIPEGMAQPHLSKGRLKRVLADWCQPYSGYHLFYPSRRQSSAAFALVVAALRHKK